MTVDATSYPVDSLICCCILLPF